MPPPIALWPTEYLFVCLNLYAFLYVDIGLNIWTLLQVKSVSNMPSLLGAINNMKLVKCGASLRDLNTDWMKTNTLAVAVAAPVSASAPTILTSAAASLHAAPAPSAAAAAAKLAQLQDKIVGWKSELALQAKSLDEVLRSKAQESYIKAAGEWEPFRSRFMQTPEVHARARVVCFWACVRLCNIEICLCAHVVRVYEK